MGTSFITEAFHSAYKNDVILAYHWSIKMYTSLPFVIQSVYRPIIGHLYCMTSFFSKQYKELIITNKPNFEEQLI